MIACLVVLFVVAFFDTDCSTGSEQTSVVAPNARAMQRMGVSSVSVVHTSLGGALSPRASPTITVRGTMILCFSLVLSN